MLFCSAVSIVFIALLSPANLSWQVADVILLCWFELNATLRLLKMVLPIRSSPSFFKDVTSRNFLLEATGKIGETYLGSRKHWPFRF